MRENNNFSSALTVLYFDRLPQRAKELFFEYMGYSFPSNSEDKSIFVEVMNLDYMSCQSPIEIIFNYAFDMMVYDRHFGKKLPHLRLESQYRIVANGKNYRADFYFDANTLREISFSFENPLRLVIECDGHNFHEKTKEQVMRNNDRNFDLQKEGYEVLHFSGSQIYNEPFECANKAIDYIMAKIGKVEKI